MSLLINFLKNLAIIVFLTLTLKNAWSYSCDSSIYKFSLSDAVQAEGCGGISKEVGTNIEVSYNTSYLYSGYYIFVIEVVGSDRYSDSQVYNDSHFYKEIRGYVNHYGELETDLPWSSVSYSANRTRFSVDFVFPLNIEGDFNVNVSVYEDFGWNSPRVCSKVHRTSIYNSYNSNSCNNIRVNDTRIRTFENDVVERSLQCLD